jgi:GTPase SAR1 family protein
MTGGTSTNFTSESGEHMKIIIAGLDNSGKSSVVLSLKGANNLLSFARLRPTLGHEITRINDYEKKVMIWDLGGQEKYRYENVENFEKFSPGVQRFIYLVDVQDRDRYDLSLEYFQQLVNKFPDHFHPEIFLFLHKFDPILENNPDYSDLNLYNELVKKFKDKLPAKSSLQVFKTTIFTIFRKTNFSMPE